MEETGLGPDEFGDFVHAPNWIEYELPKGVGAGAQEKIGKGQVQAWFLLRTSMGDDDPGHLLEHAVDDEFVGLAWAKPSKAIKSVVPFKREAYRKALAHFAKTAMRGNANWKGLG